ncbi:MAG: helix-turn-helix domain-containing protein [Victivallales bacterium]|nr:helix-turn-helix domain-containing protein [Victivallales bacterium]
MIGRQSFNRGIAIMKLLAANGGMTASDIARELEINQSSVSRLLQSLISAGFVYKPGFQRFALDYGILTFAGVALDNFPLASAAAKVCNSIHERHSCGVAVAVLSAGRLLYLAFTGEAPDSGLKLIDDSDYPIHRSSLGLVLCCTVGEQTFMELVPDSIRRHEDTINANILYRMVREDLSATGVYRLNQNVNGGFNAARPFIYSGRPAALGIFHHGRSIDSETATAVLGQGVKALGGDPVPEYS